MSKGLRKLPNTIWILAAGLLCVGAGQSVVFITIPPIARNLGLSEIQIGSIFAISAFVWMLFSPFWGSLSDTIGRKKVVTIGLLGFGISLILFSLTISFGQAGNVTGLILFILLVSARVLNGLFGSATRPASGAWIADISSIEDRSRAFARLDSGFSMGRILGPAVAGFLLLISYTAPFYLFAVGAFAVIGLISRQQSPKLISKQEKKPRLSIFNSKVWPFLLVSAAFGVCNAALVQTSSFYFQDVIYPNSDNYITLASVGFMLSALGILNGQLLIADRLQTSPGSLIRLGVVLIFLSLIAIANSSSLVHMYLSLFFYGLGGGMLGPGISSSLSLSVGKENQGSASGFLGMVIPIGHVISPLISMPLYMLNPSYPYYFGSTLMFFSIFFVLSNKRHLWIKEKGYRDQIVLNDSIDL
ncbi:MAG TPA: MFS transporter [SAR86 cluster bacterium]|nr:MFS transporter [SAR86 cluster bacterium]|tara:strand:- start:18098 stop:19345 length:1248 start_codon:yes stop_codon:yes gene_type:complete